MTAQNRATSRGVALIVAVAWFMQNLDISVIGTSLPQIAATFGVATVNVNIGITAYVVAGAAFIPLGGWTADRYGARPVFAIAIALFGTASLACAASTSLWMFVLTRVVQGAAAALMTPVGRVIVLRSAGKDQLLKTTSLITWPGLIAPVIGPVLGGALTSWIGWQWNFLLNVPLAIAGTVLVAVYVPDHRETRPQPLDRTGAALTIASLGLSVYGMSQIAQPGALDVDLAALIAGTLLGVAAVWWLRRAPHPLIDLAPLRVPTFAAATLYAGNIIRLAISATPFLLPLMLQEAWHLTPLDAGKIVLVYGLGNLVLKTITTPLLRALGFRTVLVGNGIAVAASIGALGLLTAHTPLVLVCLAAFAAGATRSIEFTGVNTLTFADVAPDQQAPASTFFSMMQQVSTALGVAAAATILTSESHGSSPLTQADFRLALVLTGATAMIGALLMLRLARDAGHAVTGHLPRRRPEDTTEPVTSP